MYTNIYIYIYIPRSAVMNQAVVGSALIGVPCRLRMLSIFSTFDNMLKLIKSPQAMRAETDPCQGTPTMKNRANPDADPNFMRLVAGTRRRDASPERTRRRRP